ncbi:hypothetical protein BSPLISOX_2611 [uncultured Gammaproteobacteria bacterium]|nr:hypothetical protein BSPLISOX_2581 [uncultured Gammaproteobacteria bacterium]VVH67462.1 hypothetical protein BSPLISOX_2611 [uncultured Gammaproteobacteria bacterium]
MLSKKLIKTTLATERIHCTWLVMMHANISVIPKTNESLNLKVLCGVD